MMIINQLSQALCSASSCFSASHAGNLGTRGPLNLAPGTNQRATQAPYLVALGRSWPILGSLGLDGVACLTSLLAHELWSWS